MGETGTKSIRQEGVQEQKYSICVVKPLLIRTAD